MARRTDSQIRRHRWGFSATWGVVVAGATALTLPIAILGCGDGNAAKSTTLLNVSYDPTRQLYIDLNQAFQADWVKQHGQELKINQSHGGSGKQARSVIDGLEADVVTLALAYDIDVIEDRTGLIGKDWQARLPNHSCPYTSTIVFLVRAGNPKGIKDWDDLIREGVAVITPNPLTSGGARWNYLAAWGYVLKRELGDLARLNDPSAADRVAAAQVKAQDFVKRLFKNVPVLDTGARGSTNTFVRGTGDVLIAWENEALLQKSHSGGEAFEIVVPSISILAEPPVAVVTANARKHGVEAIATAYLEYLYTKTGQEIVARHFYRPSDSETADRHKQRFSAVTLFTIEAAFGGWRKAQAVHFDDGGLFHGIHKP